MYGLVNTNYVQKYESYQYLQLSFSCFKSENEEMLYVCLQKAVFCDFYVFIADIDNHNFCMFFLLAIFKWLPKDLKKKNFSGQNPHIPVYA